jgi:hypothetical protein
LSVQIDADFAATKANLRNLHVERRAAVRARTAAIVADFDGGMDVADTCEARQVG